MRLLIDADGCPLMGIAVQLAKHYQIDCTIICVIAHHIEYLKRAEHFLSL